VGLLATNERRRRRVAPDRVSARDDYKTCGRRVGASPLPGSHARAFGAGKQRTRSPVRRRPSGDCGWGWALQGVFLRPRTLRKRTKRAAVNLSDNFRATQADLRERIIRSLRGQGFRIGNGTVLPPTELSKDRIRQLHETAVDYRIEQAVAGLGRKEKELLGRVAAGKDVVPPRIRPRLVEVLPDSDDELLFRYASLHWSIPVSSGYGRRLRFLVVDEHNGKLIGLIGLGDPVYSLAPRDRWVGWTPSDRRTRLSNVMDAFVLGAVPPYSFLLCGKLIAMLAASNTVRNAFKRKYAGARSLISRKVHDGRLALVTTTSALGRSSIYNRLRLGERLLYRSVGFTRGSGEFQFSNGLYGTIARFAQEHCEPTAKQGRWGTGFRSRREVVKKCLPALGLPSDWLYHGIEREVFVIPLAANSREFLRGEHSRLMWYDHTESRIFEYFRERWLMPRSERDERYKLWHPDEWRLWCGEGANQRRAASPARSQLCPGLVASSDTGVGGKPNEKE
jgi:hypothetical protein